MTKTCLLDYDTIAGADKFGNIFVLRVPPDVSDDIDNPTGASSTVCFHVLFSLGLHVDLEPFQVFRPALLFNNDSAVHVLVMYVKSNLCSADVLMLTAYVRYISFQIKVRLVIGLSSHDCFCRSSKVLLSSARVFVT